MDTVDLEVVVAMANTSARKSSSDRLVATGERSNAKDTLNHVIGFQAGVCWAKSCDIGMAIPADPLRDALIKIANCRDHSTIDGIRAFAREALGLAMSDNGKELVLVPRKLTDEMRSAYWVADGDYNSGSGEAPDSQWKAMLVAALLKQGGDL